MLAHFIIMDSDYISSPVAFLVQTGDETVPSMWSEKGPVITTDIKKGASFELSMDRAVMSSGGHFFPILSDKIAGCQILR